MKDEENKKNYNLLKPNGRVSIIKNKVHSFANWKKDVEQVDDVTVIGIRI